MLHSITLNFSGKGRGRGRDGSIIENNCAHMHFDVDLRSRRMWAASYRLTRLEMKENSEYLESFCTGHARVRAERGGDR